MILPLRRAHRAAILLFAVLLPLLLALVLSARRASGDQLPVPGVNSRRAFDPAGAA